MPYPCRAVFGCCFILSQAPQPSYHNGLQGRAYLDSIVYHRTRVFLAFVQCDFSANYRMSNARFSMLRPEIRVRYPDLAYRSPGHSIVVRRTQLSLNIIARKLWLNRSDSVRDRVVSRTISELNFLYASRDTAPKPRKQFTETLYSHL